MMGAKYTFLFPRLQFGEQGLSTRRILVGFCVCAPTKQVNAVCVVDREGFGASGRLHRMLPLRVNLSESPSCLVCGEECGSARK